MAFKETKSLYHSDLAKAGGVTLMRKGDPRDGKHGRYCMVKIAGDPPDKDYFFTLENDRVEQALVQVPKDEWVEVTAAGSRAAASLSVAFQNGANHGAQPAADDWSIPDEAPPQYGAPPVPAGGKNYEAMMIECLKSAGRVVNAFRDEFNRDPTQVDQDLAVTLFIQSNR